MVARHISRRGRVTSVRTALTCLPGGRHGGVVRAGVCRLRSEMRNIKEILLFFTASLLFNGINAKLFFAFALSVFVLDNFIDLYMVARLISCRGRVTSVRTALTCLPGGRHGGVVRAGVCRLRSEMRNIKENFSHRKLFV